MGPYNTLHYTEELPYKAGQKAIILSSIVTIGTLQWHHGGTNGGQQGVPTY